MCGAKRRIDPFHQKASWSIGDSCSAIAHIFHSRQYPSNYFVSAFRNAAYLRDMTNILENIGETGWFQNHHSRRSRKSFRKPRDRAITDSAHVAQLLGENHIRSQFTEQRFVDRIDRPL